MWIWNIRVLGVLEGVDNRKLKNSTLVKSKDGDIKKFLYYKGVPEKISWVPTPESRLYGEIEGGGGVSCFRKYKKSGFWRI